eukprot:12400494-Karenia_brevis.AAC.1
MIPTKCFYDNALVAGSQGGPPLPDVWNVLICTFQTRAVRQGGAGRGVQRGQGGPGGEHD